MTDAPSSGFSRRWLWFYGAVIAVVVLVKLFVRYNPTPSVATGYYLHVYEWMVPGEPAVGGIVAGCVPEGEAADVARERGYLARTWTVCASGVVPALKRLAATGGQTVEVSPEGVSIDGRRVGPPPRTRDSQGRPLDPAYGTWTLGPGERWLASDHPRGFDSRYFGPTSTHARAWLLLETDGE